jgi:putative Ig domain-containing protein
MRFARASLQLPWPLRALLSLLLLLVGSGTAIPVCNRTITSGNATGAVGVALSPPYQITVSGGNPQSYNASGLPPGLTVDTNTGAISGTPTAAGTYPVTLSAIYNSGGCTTVTQPVTFTINPPVFAGFRLPDFLTPAGAGYTPRLMLQVGANGGTTTSNRFNATLEVDASGGLGTAWVPYNHFVGITDPSYAVKDGWITDAPLPVRNSSGPTGVPQAFGSTQLLQSPPDVYMKADPRATRFGIFQMDTPLTTAGSRITLSPWPNNDTNVKNGFGGTLGTDVEHIPNRFSSAVYYPATFAINGPVDARDNATTTYADNDNVTRSADAKYANTTNTGFGSSTPYNTSAYQPIILNRPFRNVAELGYAFRDLPWKTLDFFTEKSADAGLLDIFCIHDGPQVLDGSGNVIGMAPPMTVAGKISSNASQAADLQSVLAGSILDEINSTTVNKTGTGVTDAPTLANNVVSATSTTPMQNKSELITRVDPVTGAKLVETILPPGSTDNQSVKARREVVARTASSVSQTRVWNLLIDVVAQSGHYKPNATNLQNDFVVEGEQHYWVHVAIDRFTGQVLDKQIEVVNE